jgi:hypothetical protein
MRGRRLATFVAVLCLHGPAWAAPGDLDPTFDDDGIVTTGAARTSGTASAATKTSLTPSRSSPDARSTSSARASLSLAATGRDAASERTGGTTSRSCRGPTPTAASRRAPAATPTTGASSAFDDLWQHDRRRQAELGARNMAVPGLGLIA